MEIEEPRKRTIVIESKGHKYVMTYFPDIKKSRVGLARHLIEMIRDEENPFNESDAIRLTYQMDAVKE